LAKDIWVALASFCTCLCRRCLLISSSIQVSCLIRLCNDVSAFAVAGVVGVLGVCSASSCRQDPTASSAFGRVIGGFGVSLSTLSRLNGNKLVVAYLVVMFLLVNAFSLAGLYKEVKCSLPTISTPP
jgi:hypothetical protein